MSLSDKRMLNVECPSEEKYDYSEGDVKKFISEINEWEDKDNIGVFTNKRTKDRVSSSWFIERIINPLAGNKLTQSEVKE